jgi:thiamine-monophosphate kinase
MNEFELIERFFARPLPSDAFVRRGAGDDCALLDCGDRLLAITTDLLLEGRHFLPGAEPESLGHKALAVNLSDLAAAGAAPRTFQLALGLPRADAAWLDAFCRGMFALAGRHGCLLSGGDTTRVPCVGDPPVDGPLTICITALGEVPRDAVRTRGGAQVGDDLWVSGTLGDARAALACRRGEIGAADETVLAAFARRMDRPEARVALGLALRGVATAAIDVSDGMLGDLGHILKRSGVGAVVDADRLPRSAALHSLSLDRQRQYTLCGGDDYELLFTAPAARREAVDAAARAAKVDVSRIGRIVAAGDGLQVVDAGGEPLPGHWRGFDHFAELD